MRVPATDWLQHFDAACVLAFAGDAEGVHQVRVALRRLRVWLSFEGHRALRREARWLCGALAELRDLDVFGEALRPAWRERLRPDIEAAALQALRSRRTERLRERLEQLEPPRKRSAHRRLAKLERRLERTRRHARPGDGEGLHALRRTLRRVRYAREWLGLDAADLAREQEQLGVLCDLLALEAFSIRHLQPPPPALRDGIARGFALLSEAPR